MIMRVGEYIETRLTNPKDTCCVTNNVFHLLFWGSRYRNLFLLSLPCQRKQRETYAETGI